MYERHCAGSTKVAVKNHGKKRPKSHRECRRDTLGQTSVLGNLGRTFP